MESEAHVLTAGEPDAPALSHAERAASLGTIGGLDVARGLRLFGGRLDLYLRLLDRFAEIYAGGVPQLNVALAAADVASIAAAAHSLRGASASIGAARVEEMAGVLEMLAGRGASAEDLRSAAVAAQHALADLVERVRPVLGPAASPVQCL